MENYVGSAIMSQFYVYCATFNMFIIIANEINGNETLNIDLFVHKMVNLGDSPYYMPATTVS